ncbi:MAG: hypothetical protein P4M11_10615 [Candidatus Pacebacteria bacterium]|nr:hypothetical protein [Candidatus Paceibacterota bacterium]
MRSTVKGESIVALTWYVALATNIARFDTLKKMKLSSLLKYTSKICAKKVSTIYERVSDRQLSLAH